MSLLDILSEGGQGDDNSSKKRGRPAKTTNHDNEDLLILSTQSRGNNLEKPTNQKDQNDERELGSKTDDEASSVNNKPKGRRWFQAALSQDDEAVKGLLKKGRGPGRQPGHSVPAFARAHAREKQIQFQEKKSTAAIVKDAAVASSSHGAGDDYQHHHYYYDENDFLDEQEAHEALWGGPLRQNSRDNMLELLRKNEDFLHAGGEGLQFGDEKENDNNDFDEPHPRGGGGGEEDDGDGDDDGDDTADAKNHREEDPFFVDDDVEAENIILGIDDRYRTLLEDNKRNKSLQSTFDVWVTVKAHMEEARQNHSDRAYELRKNFKAQKMNILALKKQSATKYPFDDNISIVGKGREEQEDVITRGSLSRFAVEIVSIVRNSSSSSYSDPDGAVLLGRGGCSSNSSKSESSSSGIGFISTELDDRLRKLVITSFGIENSIEEPLMNYTTREDKDEMVKQQSESLDKEKLMGKNLNRRLYIRQMWNNCQWFDICPSIQGCVVFAGAHLESLDQCPSCGTERFRECVYGPCKKRGKCNCMEANRKRVAIQRVCYRPIIPWIAGLTATKGFLAYINFRNMPPPAAAAAAAAAPSSHPPHHIRVLNDIREGRIMKKEMADMDAVYAAYCENHGETEATLGKVNLCFEDFVDGAQKSKHKKVPWDPIVIWIVNLPISLRNKVNVGMHLPFVYQLAKGTEVERFLFMNLYVKELALLKQGVVIYCPINKRKYLYQGRVVSHGFDTPQLGESFHMTIQRGYFGCGFCGGNCPGKGRGDGISMCFSGHRQWLDLQNYIRTFGQSEFCCPPNMYTGYNTEFFTKTKLPDLKLDRFCAVTRYLPRNLKRRDTLDIMKKGDNQIRNNNKVSLRIDGDICSTDIAFRAKLSGVLKNVSAPYTFEHSEFVDKQLFNPFLYYPFCDFREPPNGGINRALSNDDYYNFSERANRLNESFAKCRLIYKTIGVVLKKFGSGEPCPEYDPDLHSLLEAYSAGRKRGKEKEDAIFKYFPDGNSENVALRVSFSSKTKLIWVEGFSGKSYFHELQFNFCDHVRFGPWHSLSNLCGAQLWAMNTSKRLHTAKIALFCKKTHSHPSLIRGGQDEDKLTKKKKSKTQKKNDDDDEVDEDEVVGEEEEDEEQSTRKTVNVDEGAKGTDESSKVGAEHVREPCRWEIDPFIKKYLDMMVQSCKVPLGHSAKFQFATGVFENMDQLKCSGKLQVFTVLIEMMLFWAGSGLDVAYKSFWLLWHLCLMDIQRPSCPTDLTIQAERQKRLTEFICLYEGLFPMNESTFVMHQVFDMLKNLDGFSSFKDVSESGGERGILAHIRMLAEVPGGLSKDIAFFNNVVLHATERSLAVFDREPADFLSMNYTDEVGAEAEDIYRHDKSSSSSSSSSTSSSTASNAKTSSPSYFARRLASVCKGSTRFIGGEVHCAPEYLITLQQPMKNTFAVPTYRQAFSSHHRGSLFIYLYKHSSKVQAKYYSGKDNNRSSVFERFFKGLKVLYQEANNDTTTSDDKYKCFLQQEAFVCKKVDGIIIENIGLTSIFQFWVDMNEKSRPLSGGLLHKKRNQSKLVSFQVTELLGWVNMFSKFLGAAPKFYQSAYIFGHQYHGMESHLHGMRELWQHWHLNGSSRAWAHIHGFYDDAEFKPYVRNLGHIDDYYAQLKKFFRVDFPADPNVHNVPFATTLVHKSFRTRVIEKCDFMGGDDSNIRDSGLNFPFYLENVIVAKEHWGLANSRKHEDGFVALERIGSPVITLGCYKKDFSPPPYVSSWVSKTNSIKLCEGNREYVKDSLAFTLGHKHLQHLAKEKLLDPIIGKIQANAILQNDSSNISFLQLIDLEPTDYIFSSSAPTHDIVKLYQNNPAELDTEHPDNSC